MKQFRRLWMICVALAVFVFIVFKGLQMIKTDSSGPVISGGGDKIEVSIHDGEDVLLQGITATDKKDGDVTSSLLVESISNFYDDYTRTVTYAAFDSDNHISKVQREIHYSDYTMPRFELSGSLRFRAGEAVNIDTIVKAKDCLDGDLSNKIKIHMDTTINNRMTGFYQVVYEVSNSAGDNVKLPIDVEIYEPYNDEVELTLDRYLVYYDGESIDYKSFLKNRWETLQDIGYERGGWDKVGSCIWADIRESVENELYTDKRQIVGHTQLSENPYITSKIACLDVRKCFMLDTETNEIKPLTEEIAKISG